MLWKQFNDQLALLLMVLIILIWIGDVTMMWATGFRLNESVMGATIVVFTLIAQFYFRRKEPNGEVQPPK